jgi:hypothetical protein
VEKSQVHWQVGTRKKQRQLSCSIHNNYVDVYRNSPADSGRHEQNKPITISLKHDIDSMIPMMIPSQFCLARHLRMTADDTPVIKNTLYDMKAHGINNILHFTQY